MQREITKEVTKVIHVCDHENCNEELTIFYPRKCHCCWNEFCNDHIFQVGEDDDYEVFCEYCVDIYDELIEPLLSEVYLLHEERAVIMKKVYAIEDRMKEIGKKNYAEKVGKINGNNK